MKMPSLLPSLLTPTMEVTPSPLGLLPVDLWAIIIPQLDPRSLCAVSRASKSLYELGLEQWPALLKKRWSHGDLQPKASLAKETPGRTPKELSTLKAWHKLYKRRHKIDITALRALRSMVWPHLTIEGQLTILKEPANSLDALFAAKASPDLSLSYWAKSVLMHAQARIAANACAQMAARSPQDLTSVHAALSRVLGTPIEDLELAALHIAQVLSPEEPHLVTRLSHHLDVLGQECGRRIQAAGCWESGAPGEEAPARAALQVVHDFLFKPRAPQDPEAATIPGVPAWQYIPPEGYGLGLKGNSGRYYDSSNSRIDAVLATGYGIPITLCLIHQAIARRCGLAVALLNTPGHVVNCVMLRLCGPPPERPGAPPSPPPSPADVLAASRPPHVLYADAFDEGALIDPRVCPADLMAVLQASPPMRGQKIGQRMCANLMSRGGLGEIALLPIHEIACALDPTDPQLWVVRFAAALEVRAFAVVQDACKIDPSQITGASSTAARRLIEDARAKCEAMRLKDLSGKAVRSIRRAGSSTSGSGLASSMDALMIMEAAAAEDLLADAATSHQGSSTSVPPATAAPGAVGGVAGGPSSSSAPTPRGAGSGRGTQLRFRVGDLVRHKTAGGRAVVIDWQIGGVAVAEEPGDLSQPHYRLLRDDRGWDHSTFMPERKLEFLYPPQPLSETLCSGSTSDPAAAPAGAFGAEAGAGAAGSGQEHTMSGAAAGQIASGYEGASTTGAAGPAPAPAGVVDAHAGGASGSAGTETHKQQQQQQLGDDQPFGRIPEDVGIQSSRLGLYFTGLKYVPAPAAPGGSGTAGQLLVVPQYQPTAYMRWRYPHDWEELSTSGGANSEPAWRAVLQKLLDR